MGRPPLHRSEGQVAALSMVSGVVDEDQLTDGFMFDGSSIAGWKAINESDMILKPDLDAVYVDPFSATPMMVVVLRHRRPVDRRALRPRPALDRQARRGLSQDHRHRRHRLCRPRSRILHVRRRPLRGRLQRSYFQIDDIELPTNTGREYEGGNLGHRPRAKGGYFPVAPVDSAMDIRGEMVSTMLEMGLPCDKHHHEVAAAQHELGLTFGTLVQTADRMQIYKYVVHMVAQAYGKTATFMPKPIQG